MKQYSEEALKAAKELANIYRVSAFENDFYKNDRFGIQHCHAVRCSIDAVEVHKELKSAWSKMMPFSPEVICAKRSYRRYFNADYNENGYAFGDYDRLIIRDAFPESIKTYEEADKYFKENLFQSRHNSMCDCTCQEFTNWYKIFNRRGRFFYYCSESVDC